MFFIFIFFIFIFLYILFSYLYIEDDNLHGEFKPLLDHIDPDISWARPSLGSPEAVNIWIGNHRSTSALHKDNYENLYCVISGTKTFVLISPLEVACVRERTLPSATYKRVCVCVDKGEEEEEGGEGNQKKKFIIVPDDPPAKVHGWPTLDPDDPHKRQSPFWKHCRPLRVDVGPGEMLYLPALW